MTHGELSTASVCWRRPGWHVSPQGHPPVIDIMMMQMDRQGTEAGEHTCGGGMSERVPLPGGLQQPLQNGCH